MDNGSRTSIAQRAAKVSVVSTTVVVLFKLIGAGLSGSIAVLAEALQSTLDVAMSLAALWTIRLADKPADDDHPYGHGKAELILSAFQMVTVVLTAAVIAWQAALRLHDPRPITVSWGLAAMLYSLVANMVLIVYLKRQAQKCDSAALDSEAEHQRGDVFASLGVLCGLLAYNATGIPQIDPLVAMLFTIIGAVFALLQLRKVVHQLMDGALPPEDLATIERILVEHPDSKGYHNVRTRRSGSLRIVSMHVLLDDDLSFVAAHNLAENIESEVSEALGGALVTVHYEPYEAELAHQRLEHGGN